MRKVILLITLFISLILCLGLIFFGLKIGNFRINSYSQIAQINLDKETILSNFKNKSITKYKNNIEDFKSVKSNYESKKTEYKELVDSGKITETVIKNSIELYDMDYLWTKIGNYATQKDIKLQLDVTKSNTSSAISSEYLMCDLSFTITGEYIPITEFIYLIEDDDELGFEIRNFVIEKGGDSLQATFKVKDVPINSKDLISVSNSVKDYEDILTEESTIKVKER